MGKSVYQFHDPSEQKSLQARRHILGEFEHALLLDQLVLYYQPKISLRDGSVIGLEALVRWRHPHRGFLLPDSFISHLHGTAAESALGEWVLATVLEHYMQWRSQDIDLPVSINISPRQLQASGFAQYLGSLLAKYPPEVAGKLELEILETSSVEDIRRVAKVMNMCRKLGVRFALDDFGTGYSSLTYFHRLQIDVLKIDQHFVRGMIDDPNNLDIVEGVVYLSNTLGRPVVAEGVETIEHGLLLAKMGCDYAQGFGIARPMPAGELAGWLERWNKRSSWHNLQQLKQGLADCYDLETAKFSHREWLSDFLEYVQDANECRRPEMDEQKSPFARWYKGIGRTRYGRNPSYPHLFSRHVTVHRLAQEITELLGKGDHQGVNTKTTVLKEAGNELTALLNTLKDD